MSSPSEQSEQNNTVVMRLPECWHVKYNPKPIPDRRWDWDYWHDDYDYCGETGSNGLSGLLLVKLRQ